MSKLVRIQDSVTDEFKMIPAAELAPGMMHVRDAGTGETFWIEASKICPDTPLRHPPFKAKLRKKIDEEIRIPLYSVRPWTLLKWENGFRRDTHPEREIEIWCRIALRFTMFNEKHRLSLRQQKECLDVMTIGSTCAPEHVLETVQLQSLPRDLAQAAIQELIRPGWDMPGALPSGSPREAFGIQHPSGAPVMDYSAIESFEEFKELVEGAEVIATLDKKTRAPGVMYGVPLLNSFRNGSVQPRSFGVVVLALDYETDQLEHLCAATQVVKGRCDWNK